MGVVEEQSGSEFEEEAKSEDEKHAAYADAQAKADSVLAAFGKSASRPLRGEARAAVADHGRESQNG